MEHIIPLDTASIFLMDSYERINGIAVAITTTLGAS
jgi:hypothetical protein